MTQSPPPAAIDFTWGVPVPMRDGVALNATLYRPRTGQPVPAIFTMTPYTADSYHARAMYFAAQGYAFALVDCRGRGNSEGLFDGMGRNEARDGYDVVEWLAAQPWCSGQVAMWGGSYAGMNQWQTLGAFPPHLATIVPAAAACPGVDFPMYRNIPYTYDIRWATLTSGRTANSQLFADDAFWDAKFRELYRNHRPFTDLAAVVGNPAPYFMAALEHPTVDAFFDSLTPDAAAYARFDVPILTITGHYDDDQPGALAYYQRHMAHGSPAARDRHYLIIGPWDHAGTRTPSEKVGGLTFGQEALLDLNALHAAWYGWVMLGGPRPEFLRQRVAYYVTGADVWKYADSLDAIADERRLCYLDSAGGGAGDVFHSGWLRVDGPGEGPPDSFTYDPLDTRPGEAESTDLSGRLVDQRPALSLRGDGLVYHSAPFEQAAEITGQPRLTLYLAMDVPDTDFEVWLYEITDRGAAILLTGDHLRARYRHSLREETLVTPGEITRYDFDAFTFISRQVARGSRLRLVIRCHNSIHWQKNYNSGGVVASETAADARTAHITLYHDADHPSVLELPIVHSAG